MGRAHGPSPARLRSGRGFGTQGQDYVQKCVPYRLCAQSPTLSVCESGCVSVCADVELTDLWSQTRGFAVLGSVFVLRP